MVKELLSRRIVRLRAEDVSGTHGLPTIVTRYLALRPAERRLLARAFISLIMIDIALRLPTRRSLMRRALATASFPADAIDPGSVWHVQRYAHWIELASRHHLIPARCLHRSLVLHRWLIRDGMPSTLRIGVRKDGGLLKAHAWVEVGGHVVNDFPGAVAAFTPLTYRDAQASWDWSMGDAPRSGKPGILAGTGSEIHG